MSKRSQTSPHFSRSFAVSAIVGGFVLTLTGPLAAQPQPGAAKQPAAATPNPPAPAANAQPAPRTTADAKLRKQMAIDMPLMTLKEDAEYKRAVSLKIRKILREGVLDAESKSVIDKWIEWRLYRMTITEVPPAPKVKPRPQPPRQPMAPAAPGGDPMAAGGIIPGAGGPAAPEPAPLPPIPFRRQLADFNKTFLQEIRGAAKFQNNPPKATAFRKYVLDGIIKKSRDLFDNNFYVRLNVVILLSRLNIVEGNFGGKGAVAYSTASVPLLEILRDKEQHDAVRIPAVAGLQRILLIGRADSNVKNDIALELMAQLENKSSMYWYQMRLVEALGWVDEPLIKRLPPNARLAVQKPFHVQVLVDAMREPARHWIVRTGAAKALGRVSLHGSVSAPLIAREIVVLSKQISEAYNKGPDLFYWNQCFLNLYLAFKPLDRDERAMIARVKPATLISKFDANNAIVDAYRQILPPVRHILKQPSVVNNVRANQPIPAATVKATTTWLSENKPSINRLAPGMPVLADPEPTAAKVDDPVLKPAAIVRDN